MGCQPNLLTLFVEPSRVTRRAGEVIEVSVSVVRRTSMDGVMIYASMPQHPKKLNFKPINLVPTQTQATLRLRLDERVQLPPRVAVEIFAKSSRDGLPVSAVTTLTLLAP